MIAITVIPPLTLQGANLPGSNKPSVKYHITEAKEADEENGGEGGGRAREIWRMGGGEAERV